MSNNSELNKLSELIQDIRIAMFVTQEQDTLRSRPMATHGLENGFLWFFTYKNSHKKSEIEAQPSVNISYQDPSKELYVSVSGNAEIVEDRAKIEELWKPFLKAWFPNGKEDPNIALIRVDISQAEYWDAPSSTMVQLIGMVKAAVTGKPYQAGENKKISV